MILTVALPDSGTYLLTGIGSVFITLSAIKLMKSERLSGKGISTQAEVTRLVWKSDGDGGLYYPEFRFSTTDGNEYSVVSDIGTAPASFRAGQAIRILYDPEDPASAVIDTVTQMWLWPGVVGVAGLAALGIGIGRCIAHWFPL